MIKVFGQTDTSFSSNGDIVLRPLKAKVHKEDNGDYYLDLETSLDYVDYLVDGNIIVAPTPQGEQAFRVSNPQKTKTKISVKAWHVFYDSENYLIADSYVVDKNCNDALDHLNSATEPQSPFSTLSDVGVSDSFRCVRKSLYEAVQTVLERWGGHLVRDNFSIQIRNNIGQDNGVTVRYAKNLKDITVSENWDNVVTQILPVGKDGILLNAVDETASIYLVSDTQYPIPYTKTVSFEQELEQENYASESEYQQALVADLREQAWNYMNDNCVPQVNYTLSANIEKLTDIGDTIEVVDDRLGLNLLTNVISFEYDCILGKYTQIEFGNFKQTLSGLVSNITATVDKTINDAVITANSELQEQLQQATDDIWGTLGDSYVIYDGDKIMVVDRLPKETAVNVLLINNGGIGFSQTGINGTFTSAWTIDGTLNMQAINVINLVADMIKGGTLKLGSHSNVSGVLELYDDTNTLIGQMDRNGLKMYGTDGSYVLINNEIGFAGYDRNGNQIYWVARDEFHMKKAVVEEEITLSNHLRFIPITITQNGQIVNQGIGLVSTGGD
jgi:phage minor structural protein